MTTSAAPQATAKTPTSGAVGMMTPDWKIVGPLAALCAGGVVLA